MASSMQFYGVTLTEKELFESSAGGINFDKYSEIPVKVEGNDVPTPLENFSDAACIDVVKENIKRSGYTKPTPVQKHSMPILFADRDLMSCAQTGSGKTAAFLLPMINKFLARGIDNLPGPEYINNRRCQRPVGLILAPTRELAIQIHKESVKFSYGTNLHAAILYGGRENYREQINKLNLGSHIVIATPGRLIDVVQQGYLSLGQVRCLVLDEADRMLDMGFEPQIRRIQALGLREKEKRTTAMFSATFPREIQSLARDFLRPDYIYVTVGRVGSTTENIVQNVEWVEEYDKRGKLMDMIGKIKEGLALVFVETKRNANDLTLYLGRSGVRAVTIHGDLNQAERERNLYFFKNGSWPILVATAVAARGLDIPDVRHVINFDIPSCIDEYVHRIGRTGRAGNIGYATSFFNDRNAALASSILNLLTEAKQNVPEWLQKYSSGPVTMRRPNMRGSAGPRRNFSAPNGFNQGGGGGGYGGYSGGRGGAGGYSGFASSNGGGYGQQQQSGYGYPAAGGPSSFRQMNQDYNTQSFGQGFSGFSTPQSGNGAFSGGFGF
ncbi:unnamed protein product, partial [Mesorhabditis spiculigera]